MRRTRWNAYAVSAVMSLWLGTAGAGQAQEFELEAAPPPVSGTDTIEVRLKADGTSEELQTRRLKVLTEGGIKLVAKQSIQYQGTLEDVAVVEAYTEKADGRRLDVDRSGITTRDLTIGEIDVHDEKVRQIIFPDVAVGDTVVLTVRDDKKSIFRGQYSQVFAPETLVTATVRVIAPKDMWLNVAVYGDDYEHKVVYEDDTVTHILVHPPMPAVVSANEPGAVAPPDGDIAHIVVSSYKDYWTLGRSAWAAGKPQIDTTPEISALADEITAGLSDHRAQAEAIDRWVKQHIRYVAIEIGAGGMVAHRASATLKLRYGDCKDHATLLAALLAAKGIDSELVLIHLGNSYVLPDAVTSGAFNHMIVYIPEFGLYDDPTAQTASFGVLSTQAYDQPVVRMSAKEIWVGRTPAMRAADHVSINHTAITIASDGGVTGETTETTTGFFATAERARAAEIRDVKGTDDAATDTLRSNGTPGKGLFQIGETADLGHKFVVKGQFEFGHIKLSPGMNFVAPVGLALMPRPSAVLLGARQNGRRLPFVCMSGRQVEEIAVTFAEGLPLPKPVAPRKIANAALSFTASAELNDRTLTIRREFVAHVPGQVCPATLEADIGHAMQDVIASLRMGFTLEMPAETAPVVEQAGSEKQANAGEAARVN